MGKAQNYMGGTPHRKKYTRRGVHLSYFLDGGNNWGGEFINWEGGRGDTAHTLFIGGTIGVGTPHNIERKNLAECGSTRPQTLRWSGGWPIFRKKI